MAFGASLSQVGQLQLFVSPVAAGDCGRTRFFRRDSSRSWAEQAMAAGFASPPAVSDLREGWSGQAFTRVGECAPGKALQLAAEITSKRDDIKPLGLCVESGDRSGSADILCQEYS